MRIMFVCWPFEDQGSGLVIQGYTEAAAAMGHEVAVYGCHYDKIPLNYSIEVERADAIVFLYEWTTKQYYGDQMDMARLLAKVPRERRVIVDGDGKYNHVLCAEADINHEDKASSRAWMDWCDSLTDKICQPTYHPALPNVQPFLFYAYNPAWERPLDFSAKEFSMAYVGHSKFRWSPMKRVLNAVEPVREQLGRIALVGYGWDSVPEWASRMQIEPIYGTEKSYLEHLNLEVFPAVPFQEVIDWMGKATFNPVLLRPVFGRMRLVTPRLFETPASGTIPLFALEAEHVEEIYCSEALELRLPDENGEEKILDIVTQPGHYAPIVGRIRQHLREKHSHAARLRELIRLIES